MKLSLSKIRFNFTDEHTDIKYEVIFLPIVPLGKYAISVTQSEEEIYRAESTLFANKSNAIHFIHRATDNTKLPLLK